jgi:hypothetical protein
LPPFVSKNGSSARLRVNMLCSSLLLPETPWGGLVCVTNTGVCRGASNSCSMSRK